MLFRPVAFTLSFALAAPVASANEPPPEARRAFADGKAAYDRGEYEVALREFQRAQRLAPAPSLFYNIGMAYERLGRYGESAGSFDTYLAQVGPPRTDEERAAQAKVRERSASDRALATSAAQPGYNAPPPSYSEQPQQPPPGYAPYYYYAPYGQPMMAPGMQIASRDERIRRARSQRNSGIVLLAIGGTLLVTSFALIGVAVHTNDDYDYGRYLGTAVGGTIALLGGIAITIPGAVILARGMKALNAEKHTPDDSAATRRSALDLAAPGVLLARPTLSFALPPVRF